MIVNSLAFRVIRPRAADRLAAARFEQLLACAVHDRRRITESYSDFHSALMDLLRQASVLPDYDDLEPPQEFSRRVAVAREFIRRPGPLSNSATSLEKVLEGYSRFEKEATVVALGFARAEPDRTSEPRLTFVLFEQGNWLFGRRARYSYSPAELEAFRVGFERFVADAYPEFRDAAKSLLPPMPRT